MDNTINGRTPEEIKKGLECRKRGYAEQCGYDCAKCDVYVPGYVIRELLNDTLAYIKQLEGGIDRYCGMGMRLERERDELFKMTKQLERERDAAVKDIYRACDTCKHSMSNNKTGVHCTFRLNCHMRGAWQWRGAQEV